MGEVKVGNGVLTVNQKLELVIDLVTVRGRQNVLKAQMDAVLDAGDEKQFHTLAAALERVDLVERELTAIIDRS